MPMWSRDVSEISVIKNTAKGDLLDLIIQSSTLSAKELLQTIVNQYGGVSSEGQALDARARLVALSLLKSGSTARKCWRRGSEAW